MAYVNRWPRLPYGMFDAAPTVTDDKTIGYERGFVWFHFADPDFVIYFLANDGDEGAADWQVWGDPTPIDVWAVKTSAQTGWTIDTWAKITGWTERLDTHGAYASDKFTAPRAGTLRISANIWGGTPGAGSTNTELLVGFFKNGSLVTDTVRGTSIFAGYYNTFDVQWVGETAEGDDWDIRAMFCPAAAGATTTNATVGSYTEIDAASTVLVSFCRFEMQ